MSVGYAFLLSNGATSPWHKTRDLVDEPRYREVWDGNTDLKVVAILKARHKQAVRPFGSKIDVIWIGDFSDRCAATAEPTCRTRNSAHDDEFPQAAS